MPCCQMQQRRPRLVKLGTRWLEGQCYGASVTMSSGSAAAPSVVALADEVSPKRQAAPVSRDLTMLANSTPPLHSCGYPYGRWMRP